MITENVFHHPQLLQNSKVLASMYCSCLTGESISRSIQLVFLLGIRPGFSSKPYELICVRATPLVRQNAFGPALVLRLLRLIEGTAKPNTCQTKMLGRNHPQVVEEEVRWFLWIHQTLPSSTWRISSTTKVTRTKRKIGTSFGILGMSTSGRRRRSYRIY